MEKIIKSIDEVEKYLDSSIIILPHEESFLSIITQIGCSNRREFMIKVMPEFVKEAETYNNTPYAISILSMDKIYKRAFPDNPEIITTEQQFREYKIYIDNYTKLFVLYLIQDIKKDNKKYDIEGIKHIPDFIENINDQIDFINPQNSFLKTPKETIDYVKKFTDSLPKISSSLEKTLPLIESPKKDEYHYWKYIPEDLDRLEKLLLESQFIEFNPHFKEVFKKDTVLKSDLLTTWLDSRASAYYLLYKIYDSETHEGEFLYKIADKIFKFSGKKNNPATSISAFRKFQEQKKKKNFEDYVQKKLKKIDYIFKKLLPLTPYLKK